MSKSMVMSMLWGVECQKLVGEVLSGPSKLVGMSVLVCVCVSKCLWRQALGIEVACFGNC